MVVHHGSVGITRTVNKQCASRVRLRSSAAYHPASTATTVQESTVTLVMMIHTAAQCSKKYYHRRKVRRQHLLSAHQTPCEATSAAATELHALGYHETVFCCGCKNITRFLFYDSTSRYVRHPKKTSDPSWLLRSRLQISENRSETVTLRFFSLRSGQIRGA